ncbi:hypothetical protein YC2023_053847 [Brassica napus]
MTSPFQYEPKQNLKRVTVGSLFLSLKVQDQAIITAHGIHGDKWSVNAKLLLGRTDNDALPVQGKSITNVLPEQIHHATKLVLHETLASSLAFIKLSIESKILSWARSHSSLSVGYGSDPPKRST